MTTEIYERDDLTPGQGFIGPCLVEEQTSTTVVPPGWRGEVDGVRNLIITPEGEAQP